MVWYRADYELHWLRKLRKQSVKIGRLMNKCRTFKGYAELSRALIDLCERERILLRIPLPQAAKAPEPRRVSGAVSYSDVPRSGSLVMEDATPTGESATPTPPAAPVAPPAK
jgi:hypothetical protein